MIIIEFIAMAAMPYFIISTVGDTTDSSLCILDKMPKGVGIKFYCLIEGKPIAEFYPADASIEMSAHREGIALRSLVGTTTNLLIVDKALKAAVEAANSGAFHPADLEFLPVQIIDHKGRTRASDYFIVNPLGQHDALNTEASSITYSSSGKPIRIQSFVIHSDKTDELPPIFRIPEKPSKIFVNEEMAHVMRSDSFTNVYLKPVDTAPVS